jgi:hypothetical protein
MLTLKLWRALNHPPRQSPLFKRAILQRGQPAPEFTLRIPLAGVFKNAGLIVLPVVLILLGPPILALLYYLSLLLTPLLLPLANTLYGLAHAYNASGRIAYERERQIYDLLCAAPAGVAGLHWSYCTGWLHDHLLYRCALLALLATGIVASIFGISPQMMFGAGQTALELTLARAAGLAGIFILDYVQTPIISSLTTMLVPANAENRGNARLWACSMFLALQTAVYLPLLLLGVFALPATLRLVLPNPLLSDLLTPPLALAFFALLREAIIVGLWHRAADQLSGSTVELDSVTRVAV